MAIPYDESVPIAKEKPRDPAAEAAAIQRYAEQVVQRPVQRQRVVEDAEEVG